MGENISREEQLLLNAAKFKKMLDVEYSEVDEAAKSDIVHRFTIGQSAGVICHELGWHLLVVKRVVEEAIQASLMYRLMEGVTEQVEFNLSFRRIVARMADTLYENSEEKGDSWATMDMPSLRGLLHKKLLKWIDAKETPKELSEIVDACLVAMMIGERLLP